MSPGKIKPVVFDPYSAWFELSSAQNVIVYHPWWAHWLGFNEATSALGGATGPGW